MNAEIAGTAGIHTNINSCPACGNKLGIRKKLLVQEDGTTILHHRCLTCFHEWEQFASEDDVEKFTKGIRVQK